MSGTLWLSSSQLTEAAVATKTAEKQSPADWPVYGGGVGGDRYSTLTQINRNNVHQLKMAWRVDAGKSGELQTNPLIEGRVLYAYTSQLKVLALDGATGKILWTFDSGVVGSQPSRGLSWWTDGKNSRLFAYIMNFIYALDPATGKPIPSFGDGGRLDMRKDLGSADFTKLNVALTTPGVVYKDLLICGFRAPEAKPAPRGDIRAYDVHTGKLRWTFHTIPHPGEEGYKTWPEGAWKDAGGANNWSGMVLDEKRGIIYAPTGSAVTDFYGADRLGDDLFANTLLALDANTGKKLWYFQGVHHDIWDRDFPSPPALVTVLHHGTKVDAVAQTTKHGFLFLFDRVTGQPLFPIEERPFPASNVPGESASPTQPIPTMPKPYARQRLTEDMLTTRTPEAHAWAVEQFRTFRSEGQFVPLSVNKQTVVFPGFDGGAEWGGPAVDIRSGVIYINSNDVAWTGSLAEVPTHDGVGAGIYQSQCALCHGNDRKGNLPSFPSLVDIENRLTRPQITDIVHSGRGRMPSFSGLQGSGLDALLEYLRTGQD
ncbi:MAG: c-type cytochrome, partial [Edaphobacter sp.]